MAVENDAGPRRIKSVDQTFKIVDYIEEKETASLSEIAEELGIPVSTAHIHLVTLVHNGYLIKTGSRYRCSFKFLRVGGRKRDQMVLYKVAKPEIDDLQRETGEHGNIMAAEGGYAIQLYKSSGAKTIDDDAFTGQHFHFHRTATGKAILSKFRREEVEAIIEEHGLPASTEKTITDTEALFRELEEISERGYSINREEHFRGVHAIGVAIETPDGDSPGAISISGPSSRMGDDRIKDELAPSLLTKKNIIELKIRQSG